MLYDLMGYEPEGEDTGHTHKMQRSDWDYPQREPVERVKADGFGKVRSPRLDEGIAASECIANCK